jgi:hypothetical protein
MPSAALLIFAPSDSADARTVAGRRKQHSRRWLAAIMLLSMAAGARNGRAAFGWATAAVVYAVAFTVWALLASVYSSGQTILEVNSEFSVRVAIAMPLLVTSTVWLLLHVACRFDATLARIAASTVAWLLVAFAVITGFSIGMFVLPGAVMLVAAAALTPVARS